MWSIYFARRNTGNIVGAKLRVSSGEQSLESKIGIEPVFANRARGSESSGFTAFFYCYLLLLPFTVTYSLSSNNPEVLLLSVKNPSSEIKDF